MTTYTNIFDHLPRDCWATIDTAQLAENVRILRKTMDCKVLVAVKGNGYGHGYDHAARAFVAGGASYLGVANLAEGLIIKSLGLDARILILGPLLAEAMAQAAAADIEFVVFTPEHIDVLRQLPKNATPIRVHIKVDTGMGRIGCFAEQAAGIATALRDISGVQIAGMATHFAMSNASDSGFTEGQITKFKQAVTALADKGIRPEILHPGKSSGGLYYPKARYDMVRLGIVAYGVPPSSDQSIPNGVKTAFSWQARVMASKILPKGSNVSYSGEYMTPKDMRIGVLPVGYVDGYRRIPKNCNKVLIDGQERNILGRVNMDQAMVDLDGLPDMTGAEVVLLGQQGNATISVQDLAQRWGTNTYDVYSSIALRVPRCVKDQVKA